MSYSLWKPFKTQELAEKYIEDNGLIGYSISYSSKKKLYYLRKNKPYKTSAKYFGNGISKKQYIKSARELCYPDSVIQKIKEVQTENEASRILTDARHEIY